MRKILIILLIIILLLLVACSTSEVITGSLSTPTEQPETIPSPQETSSTGKITGSAITETQTTTETNDEVKKLLEKHKNIKSYKYIIDDGVDPHIFYVKDNQYRKLVERTQKYTNPSENYDTIFIDRNEKKAYAYCNEKSRTQCPLKYRTEAYELNYGREDVILPLDLLQNIDSAEIIGKGLIDNRKVLKIKATYQNNQNKILLIDPFHGFVFKQDILNNNDEVIETHTYTRVVFNTLTDEDVSLPQGTQIK